MVSIKVKCIGGNMRVYKIIEIDDRIIDKVFCNKCGREIISDNGVIKEGVFSVNYEWGYFSEKDGQSHGFDLCEQCYDKMISEFVIQPEKKEINEFLY